MRTIGHIEHPSDNITVLSHNNKVTLQFESGLLSQSYSFRDGSPVSDIVSATTYCDAEFIAKIEKRFAAMNKDYFDQFSKGLEEEFPEII